MTLANLENRWIDLHDELCMIDEANRERLAAPFLSIGAESNLVYPKGQILLVGKATAGPFWTEEFNSAKRLPINSRVQERKSCTRRFLSSREDDLSKSKALSAFWVFWNGLRRGGRQVIWTNLSKIGFKKGNPTLKFLRDHSSLACETLEAEVREYKPALVVLVTSIYAAQEIAHPVFGPEDIWKKSPDNSIWWQERTQTEPPILWVDHPGFKLKNEIDRWLEKAQELIS